MKIRSLIIVGLLAIGLQPAPLEAGDFNKAVTWDRHSLIVGGKRVIPVMGEVHYSRIPADEWPAEVRKMKEGGVTIIATYVFWNHVEEQRGIFRWDGQRDLRRFLEVCKAEGMPVVLRIGPFCHGEVRNGGLPDWLWDTPQGVERGKAMKLRSTDPRFLEYVGRLYRQIYSQVIGLQWKDGGPLIACQFDNEYRGSGDYLMALKKMALKIGFDLPFYTRTGWPELSKPVPFGEMLPLYGDYADGFWEKSLDETAGTYYKAFNFKAFRSSTAIGTDMIDYSQTPSVSGEAGQGQLPSSRAGEGHYPYFTCELGGGMATAYHRRPFIYADDTYAMAVVKLGSGSNLLGYYMYHGGTNPESTTGITLNETQRTLGTANNDLPVKNYDFQCPLGEFGQKNRSYYRLRPLHLFLSDYGDVLAPMEATFPAPQDLKKGEDTGLRWAVRSDGDKAFIFVSNYERLQPISAKRAVVLSAGGVTLPRLNIPAGCIAIFPVNIDGIRYATAQLAAKREGRIYLMQVEGIPTTIALQNGKTLKNVKPRGVATPIYDNVYLLTRQEAENLYLPLIPSKRNNLPLTPFKGNCIVRSEKVKAAGHLRPIVKGKAKVAEAPSEEQWQQAAVYRLHLDSIAAGLLSIDYQGDCARLYADGRLVADHFQYGRPMLYGLWRLPEGTTSLELRIMPLQAGAPIYLPREADHTPGEQVKKIEIIYDD